MDPQLDLNVKLTPQTTLKKTNKQFSLPQDVLVVMTRVGSSNRDQTL